MRPNWKQFIICQAVPIILALLAMAASLCVKATYTWLFLFACNLLTVFLLWQLTVFYKIRYVITEEQLIYVHGVLLQMTDYMELYRVVDYQQHQTLLQQLMGLKTVIVYSGDRNTNVLVLVGIPKRRDIVAEIRNRVERNKKGKGVYEITNRY